VAPKELRTVAQIQKEIDAIEEKNKSIRAANKLIDDKQTAFDKLKTEHGTLNDKKAEARKSWDASLQDIKDAEEIIKQQQERIARIKTNIEEYKTGIKELELGMDEVLAAAGGIKKEIENSMRVSELSTAKLKEELLAASEVTAVNEKLSRKSKLEADIKKYESSVADIEYVMADIKAKKKEKLAAFKLPVDGLEVGERDIMFSGIAFDNLSQAQKISVSMALAIAQQPTLRIIKVAEGSLFDDSTLKQVIDFAAGNDFQVWIERVANTPSGNAIYIEDGEVVK
jgi:DNA repair exonuclease SbcCD ATPase subunit